MNEAISWRVAHWAKAGREEVNHGWTQMNANGEEECSRGGAGNAEKIHHEDEGDAGREGRGPAGQDRRRRG